MFLFLLTTFSFLLRLLFLSPWLADWDSVLFAQSLHKFSLIDHQPQPPGYILYVFLGRAVNLFVNNDTLALTFLSALLGSLMLIPFYILCRQIAGKLPATIATILISATPIHLLYSITAYSEIPGEFFTTLSALLLYRGKSSTKSLLAGSFIAALAIGVRFAIFTVVIPLMLLVLIYRRSLADTIKSLIFFLAGILLWFVPLVLITGWEDFLKAYFSQANYIYNHDSLTVYNSFFSRLLAAAKLFSTGYSYFYLPIIMVIIWAVISKKITTKFSHLFIIIWLLTYATPLLFIYNLEVTRFTLPLLAPTTLLFSISIKPLTHKKLPLTGLAIIIFPLFLVSLKQGYQIKTITPPTVAPALYVNKNFKPDEANLITSYINRQFEYYSPEFTNYFSVPQRVQSQYLITDFSGLKDKLENRDDYKLIEQKTFSGPKDIFSRLPQTNLYVYKNISNPENLK